MNGTSYLPTTKLTGSPFPTIVSVAASYTRVHDGPQATANILGRYRAPRLCPRRLRRVPILGSRTSAKTYRRLFQRAGRPAWIFDGFQRFCPLRVRLDIHWLSEQSEKHDAMGLREVVFRDLYSFAWTNGVPANRRFWLLHLEK